MRRYTVLWADDQPEIIDSLRHVLSDCLQSLDAVHNATDAIALLNEKRFELVILDLQMPPGRWGGLDVLREIGPPPLRAPVVVLSGAGTTRECTQALRLGAKDYLEKEHAAAELPMIVQRAVSAWESEQTLSDYDVVRRLERKIHSYVVSTLERKANERGDASIFASLIPREVALQSYGRWLDHRGTAPQHVFLDIIDFKKIIDALWADVPEFQRLSKIVGSSRHRTSWLVRLNDARKIVAHPMRGELTSSQRVDLEHVASIVTTWVDDATSSD